MARDSDIERGDSKNNYRYRSLNSKSPQSPSSSPLASDGSWPLFSIYSEIAEKEDDKLTERYQKMADGVLIFSGLFSATIVTSLSVVFQDLRPNPQDTSAFYLGHIYQHLANPNISRLGEPITLATPPAFYPPLYAIVANAFWFISASCTIVSAALAMLLQEWAHRYLMVTRQPHFTPDQRARVREIFSNYASGRYVLWGTYPMTFFVHISIFFYILGGLIYVFNINRVVFAFLFLLAIFVPSHVGYYTMKSILKPGMLFYGPFSQPFLHICLGILYTVAQFPSRIPFLGPLFEASGRLYHNLRRLSFREGFLKGKGKAVEQVASNGPTKVDLGVLELTLNNSVIDADLEKFFTAIPGFFDSKLVKNLQEGLSNGFQTKFGRALDGFLDHTFSSNSFSGSVRGERLIICLNAARAALRPEAVLGILGGIFDGRWPAALQSTEVGHALKGWDDSRASLHMPRIVARIISRVPVHERDDRWIALVKDGFGMPDSAFEDHVASRDGISLAVLIHITRQLLRTDVEVWEPGILRGISNFDMRNTLPGQQHDFCAVWNDVVEEARRRGIGSTPTLILEELRHIYHAVLHQGTAASRATYASPAVANTGDADIPLEPFSYPFCRVVDLDHRLDSTLHVGGSPAEVTSLPSPSPSHVPDDAPPLPIPIHTSSLPTPLECVVASSGVAAAQTSPISQMAVIIPDSFPEGDPARQKVQEADISAISPPQAPIARIDCFAPTPGMLSSPSSPAAARPSTPQTSTPTIFGQVASATSTSIRSAGMHNDNPNQNSPLSTEAQSASSAPGVYLSSVRREGHEHGPL